MILILKIIKNLLPNCLRKQLTPITSIRNRHTRNAEGLNFYEKATVTSQ